MDVDEFILDFETESALIHQGWFWWECPSLAIDHFRSYPKSLAMEVRRYWCDGLAPDNDQRQELFSARTEYLSPEFRDWHDKIRAEEAKQFGPILDAMLLEAQKLRLVKGHKARERTLRSLNMNETGMR